MRRRPLYWPRLTLGQFIGLCFLGLAALAGRAALDLLRGLAAHDPARLRAAHAPGEPARDRAPRRASRRGGAPGRAFASASGPRARRPGSARHRRVRRCSASSASHPQVTEVTLTYGRRSGATSTTTAARRRRPEARARPVGAGLGRARRCRERRRRCAGSPPLAGAEPLASRGTSARRDGDRRPHARGAARGRSDDPCHLHRALSAPSTEAARCGATSPSARPTRVCRRTTRRRVVSVQKALWSNDETFLGVLRVSLLNDRIDEFARLRVDERAASADQHVVFLCDRRGRLISRLGSADRFALLDRRRQARSRRRRPRGTRLAAAAGRSRASRPGAE